jgi:putative endonuclease
MRRPGTDAEDRAADYLIGLGYTVITRRWKGRGGEIDLVCLDGDTMVFVEVKERRAGLDWALTSLSPEKVQRLFAAAETYVAQSDWSGATRFDAVLVGPLEIEHLPGGLTLSD